MKKLPEEFYQGYDVLQISRELLGKVLATKIDGLLTRVMIVEVEAYHGVEDRASHAWNNRRTARTEVMFGKGGRSYVYLCYGIHHLFNVVTNRAGIPHAILIRAAEPLEGLETMLKRRCKNTLEYKLTAGPGAMSQAMGITVALNKASLNGKSVWIEDHGIRIEAQQIIAGPRVGVAYAGEDAKLPYRFCIKDNPWCSKGK